MRFLPLFALALFVSCSTSESEAAHNPEAQTEPAADPVTFEDTDGDGLPDKIGVDGAEFTDTDGDGIPDKRESD